MIAVGGTSARQVVEHARLDRGRVERRRQLVQHVDREAELPDRARACTQAQAADVVGGRRSEHRRRGLQRGQRRLDRRRRHQRGVAVRRRRLRAVRPRRAAARATRTRNASNFFDVTTGKNGTCGNVAVQRGRGLGRPDRHRHAERRGARRRRRRLHAELQRQDLRRRRLRRQLRHAAAAARAAPGGVCSHRRRRRLDLLPPDLLDRRRA